MAFNITSTIPVSGSNSVSIDSEIRIVFSDILDPSSIDDGSISISFIDPNVSIIDSNNIGSTSGDSFINNQSSIFLSGSVKIENGNELVFTPSTKLLPETNYDVYVADTIKAQGGASLGTFYHFSFKTLSKESSAVEIEEEINLTSILGNNVDPNIAIDTSLDKFYVESTYPIDNTFLFTGDVVITFNNDIEDKITPSDFVTIYEGDLLSDYPAEDMTEFAIIKVEKNKILISDIHYTNNRFYNIVISKDLPDVDGNLLGNEYSFMFTSLFNPYYISTKLVRLNAGTLLGNHPDLHIASLIYYYSLEADMVINLPSKTNEIIDFIKKKYVLIKTLKTLLLDNMNFALHDSVSKKLSDFSLSINSKSKFDLYNQLMQQIYNWEEKYEQTLLAYNGIKSFLRNKRAAISDIGRLWLRGTDYPAINNQLYPTDGTYNLLTYNNKLLPMVEI